MEVEAKLEEKPNISTKLLSRQIRHWFQYINLKEISANIIIINNIDIFSLMIHKWQIAMILVWHFRHKNVWAKHFIPTTPLPVLKMK